jgi:hypothetical protein
MIRSGKMIRQHSAIDMNDLCWQRSSALIQQLFTTPQVERDGSHDIAFNPAGLLTRSLSYFCKYHHQRNLFAAGATR